MKTDFRYQLDSPRVTGRRQQKTTCPQCGRRKCFVRYVDTHDDYRYLHDTVGRCDHEQSCGYHYRPSEYFHDHPWMKKESPSSRQRTLTPPPPPPLRPLSMALVDACHSSQSSFWLWFVGDCARQLGFDPETVRRVYEDYRIGVADQGDIIFWQIDEQQRVRTGHIMAYDNSGHRYGHNGWVHDDLKSGRMRGHLPEGYVLQQCFFGQHLLPKYPDAHVCLVESEKTALIMAVRQAQHLWLATCSSGGLNAEKLECLRGRRFTLFPDSGCLEKWQTIMSKTKGLHYSISDQMEPFPPNTDLADLLLQMG